MPPKLENVINSPEELFEVIKQLDTLSMKASEKEGLVLVMNLFGLKKRIFPASRKAGSHGP